MHKGKLAIKGGKPVYHTLTEKDLADVVAAVKKVVTNISELKKQ